MGVFENILLLKECGLQSYQSLSTGARISCTGCLAKVRGVWHRHFGVCRDFNAFIIRGHQEIHCKCDSNTIEA